MNALAIVTHLLALALFAYCYVQTREAWWLACMGWSVYWGAYSTKVAFRMKR